ncbi:nucleic-acid-binding protein from transposon X-element [Trichonephila clavipes]|nr:nucleic-acid-binding protein from transposon X-element [Trichonephila clavipes]
MLRITDDYRVQVDTIKKIYPHLRLKTTGEYIKLYSNTTEQNRVVRQTLIQLGYRFYVITPKNDRPIKIVIKGYPKKADPEDIKKDLENEGFEPERVTQLIGRRTKQKLPIFQVTLPRTIENLKIFDLKTLAHLNITVDGYNGRGVTQCFSCNNFHHNADNCYLKPRCLKCGEEHLTKDCPIKQRLETKFCINCQVYGHMANWYGCPCFPKPPKGTAKTLDPHYKTLYNRAQKNVKKELRNYSNDNWTARLKALNAQDNSLWAVQKFLKNKRSDIPPLNCSTGTAVTDTQKANILAESILDNFTENSRPNNDYDDNDELISNTVNFFLSLPPPTTTETAYPSEIISYIKNLTLKKRQVKMASVIENDQKFLPQSYPHTNNSY